MQKRNLYSVYDEKAQTYSPPQSAKSDGEMLRSFTDFVNQNGNSINAHPEDYKLYRVGAFMDHNGAIDPEIPAVFLCNAADLVIKK